MNPLSKDNESRSASCKCENISKTFKTKAWYEFVEELEKLLLFNDLLQDDLGWAPKSKTC